MLTRRGPSLRAVVVLMGATAVHVVVMLMVAVLTAGTTQALVTRVGYQSEDIVQVPGCPALVPHDGYARSGDYFDMVVWQGRDYVAMGDRHVAASSLGPTVTTVGCSLTELGAGTDWVIAGGPWPDRTATGLASGVPLRTIPGVAAECSLAAVVDDEVRVYTAMDLDAADLEPSC